MKKFYCTLLSISLFFLTSAQNADLTFDQTWVQASFYPNQEPVGWISSNIVRAGLLFPIGNTNPTTVSKSTTFVSSPNAVKIETKKVNAGALTSLLGDTSGLSITGKINLSSPQYVDLGYSYSTKSAQLDFQYNYQPSVSTDKGLVAVVFLKRNGSVRDTIATGYTILSASPSSSFQTGNVLMTYKNISGPAPDTVIIGAASSIANVKNILGSLSIIAPPAAINSTLILDDLSFSGTVGLPKVTPEEKYVKVNYNPQTHILDIYAAGSYLGTSKIVIYDITGKKMSSKSIINYNQKIDMKDLQQGLYLFSVTDANDRVIKSGKFSVLN